MRRPSVILLSAGSTLIAATVAAQLSTKPIEVSQKYVGPEGKAELVGVCKVSETEVGCWGPDRKPKSDLVEQLKAALEKQDYSNIPVRYGKKTRLLVFRFTLPPYNSARTEGVLNDHFTNGNSFDFRTSYSSEPDQPRVSMRAAIVTTEKSQQTASVALSISRSAPPSEPLKIEDGASVTYLGRTTKIVKIVKSQLDPAVYGVNAGNRWIVYFSGEGDGTAQLSWSAVDKNDIPISAVDEAGKPIYVDPAVLTNLRNPQIDYTGNRPTTPKPNVFVATIGNSLGFPYYYNMPSQSNVFTTNIDPAEIKHVILRGSGSQSVKITGIPLDPLAK